MKDKKISASEINKFCYCNYQWYYEKVYGTANLRKNNADYVKSKNLKNKDMRQRNTNFERGRQFHNSYVRKYKIRQAIKTITFLIIIFAIIYFIYYFKLIDLGAFYE